MEDILTHVSKQRIRAKLTDKPFQIGIVTDKRPSQMLSLVHNKENEALLKEIGITDYKWHDDALRSSLRLCGEELLISICSPK